MNGTAVHKVIYIYRSSVNKESVENNFSILPAAYTSN